MASPVPTPENNRIKFDSPEEIEGTVEAQLKHRYGRGIFTHDVSETPSGDLVINLGNVIPKDLSDCREKDDVLKFVPVERIYQLHAERVNGKYILQLPDREEIIEGFEDRQNEIVNQIDQTMARTIYQDISHFGEVHNQLTPIRQILHWVRTRSPIHIQKINKNQRSDQTLDYIDVLDRLGYVSVDDDGMVVADELLDALDLNEVQSENFSEVVLGDVIQRGYTILRDELDLRILSHYPTISGAYYFDAIQREDPELWLDLDAVLENVRTQWGNRFERLYIEEKLAQLSRVGVIEKDGDFVRANPDVYDTVNSSLHPTA